MPTFVLSHLKIQDAYRTAILAAVNRFTLPLEEEEEADYLCIDR